MILYSSPDNKSALQTFNKHPRLSVIITPPLSFAQCTKHRCRPPARSIKRGGLEGE